MRRSVLVATGVVVAATIVVGAVGALIVRSIVEERAANELGRQALVAARLIEEDLDDGSVRPGRTAARQLAGHRADLRRSLERVRTVGGHDLVEATITLGDTTLAIGETLGPAGILDPGDDRSARRIVVDGVSMVVATADVDTDMGHLTVAIGRVAPLLPTDLVVGSVVVALGVGAALTIALGGWFSRRIVRRLGALASMARAVGEGDLSARVDTAGGDEIADVAAAMNAMAVELAAARTDERDFVMAVGHDLRTPLTTIRGYAEALDDGKVSPDGLPEVAGALHRQTDQLSRLVEDLVLLGRIEAKGFKLQREVVDVGSLITEVVHGYAERCRAASIDLEVVVASDDTHRELDPHRLVQIVGNLMDNALRYTPEDGCIVAGVSVADIGIEVFVENTGDGIDAVDLPHVFERQYVARRYAGVRPAGSGLGLSIVAELAAAMGGTVEASSGWGTTRIAVRLAARAARPA